MKASSNQGRAVQEGLCSEFEGQKGGVVGEHTGGNLQQGGECLSLATERVDDVLVVVSDGRLEEERKVGEDGAELLLIDFHASE